MSWYAKDSHHIFTSILFCKLVSTIVWAIYVWISFVNSYFVFYLKLFVSEAVCESSQCQQEFVFHNNSRNSTILQSCHFWMTTDCIRRSECSEKWQAIFYSPIKSQSDVIVFCMETIEAQTNEKNHPWLFIFCSVVSLDIDIWQTNDEFELVRFAAYHARSVRGTQARCGYTCG